MNTTKLVREEVETITGSIGDKTFNHLLALQQLYIDEPEEFASTDMLDWEYYESNATTRDSFKRKCEKNGEDFTSFVEVWTGLKAGNVKKYIYYRNKEKEEHPYLESLVEVKKYKRKTIDDYAEVLSTKSNFKQKCERDGEVYENFLEVETDKRNKSHKRLFYYIRKV